MILLFECILIHRTHMNMFTKMLQISLWRWIIVICNHMREWCSCTKLVSCSCFLRNCKIDNSPILTNSVEFHEPSNWIRKVFKNMARNEKILTICWDSNEIIRRTNIFNINQLESRKSRICFYENNNEVVPTIDSETKYSITLDIVEGFCDSVFHSWEDKEIRRVEYLIYIVNRCTHFLRKLNNFGKCLAIKLTGLTSARI